MKIRRMPWAAILCAAGCATPGREAARAHHLTELVRDGAGGAPDGASAGDRGRRLMQRAGELAARQDGALSLSDCFILALAQSEDLRLHGERMLQTDLLRRRTIAGVLPQVIAHGQLTRDSEEVSFGGRSFTPRQRGEHWITIQQTLWDGGLLPALDLAEQTLRIEALQLREDRDRLLFAVAGAFYEITGAMADLQAWGTAAARAAERVRVTAAELRAGEAEDQDLLSAQARQAEVEARHQQAALELERARARLARLTGLPAIPADLQDGFEVQGGPDEIPRLVDRALSERLDLALARAEIERAEAERRVVRMESLPKLKLEHNQWTGKEGGFQEDLDWTLGLKLDWTLFDSGGQRADLARARSVIRERRLQLQAQERDAKLEVEDAVLAFRSFENVRTALERLHEAAAAGEALELKRARAGEALNLDVLAAGEARADAERNLARIGWARKLAALRIRLAVGDLRDAWAKDLR